MIGADFRPGDVFTESCLQAVGFRRTGQVAAHGDIVACLRVGANGQPHSLADRMISRVGRPDPPAP